MTFSPRWIHGFVKHIFPVLRKTQSRNLSLAVFGQIKSQSAILSQIVRQVPGAVKHKHRLKRLWRFVSNYRVRPTRLREPWISWCISKFTSGKYVLVALDWTTLPGNIQCLMAAIPFKGRAIPLIWHICLHSDIKDSQNRIEERLMARLVNLMPEGKKIILTADRGFGRATFIQFLLKKNVLFVIRVKSKVWIKTKSDLTRAKFGSTKTKTESKSILLKHLKLKPNQPRWFRQTSYREDCLVSGVNLAAIVAEGSDDPWFLVTNLRKPETTISTYEKRFQIEEWFKDVKHELGISNMQTKNLKRIRRIIFISAFSYSILALAGKAAERKRKVLEQVITGPIRKTASIIWFAGHIIRHNLLKTQFWKRVKVMGVAP